MKSPTAQRREADDGAFPVASREGFGERRDASLGALTLYHVFPTPEFSPSLRMRFFDNPGLAQAKFMQWLVIVLAITVGSICAAAVVGIEGNPIGMLMKLITPLAVVISIVQPKVGLHLLIVAACYLDLIKRVAYYFGYYNSANQGVLSLQVDILSFAPATMVAIFVGVILRRVFSTKLLVRRDEYPTVGFIFLASLAIAKKNLSETGELNSALGSAANEGVYLLLLFVLPSLFKNRDEIVRFFKFILSVFIPCALLGIYQGLFGFTEVDVAWMKSGLTVTSAMLYDESVRAFGTMASPHPYALLNWFVILSTYCAYAHSKRRLTYGLLALFYLVGLFFGFGRGAWLAMLTTYAAVYLFQKKLRILTFYVSAVCVFLIFVINAQFFLDHIGDYQSVVQLNSGTARMALRMETFSERLFSIQNWTRDAHLWSWFGRQDLTGAGQDYADITHDMLGQILVRYGAIGLFLVIGFGVSGLFYFHRAIFRIRNPDDRILATLLLAMVSVNFFFACLGGASYEVFPWNIFIWSMVGFEIILCRQPDAPDGRTVAPPVAAKVLRPALRPSLHRPGLPV